MKVQQISMFLENKPGRIIEPCRVLAKNNINILTLSLADTQQFGILRLIIKEWQKAKEVLEQEGFIVNVTEVVAIEVEDKPGGLTKILEAIEETGLNIEYIYAFTFRSGDKAVIIFRFDQPDLAIQTLQQKGINVLDSVQLYDKAN